MPRKYKEISFMSGGHTKGITAVKFNSEGSMLATGGMDGNVCLWTVPTGSLVHATDGNSPITSLQWVKRRDDEAILFGSKDGNLSTLSLSTDFDVTGFWAHRYPVEHIAINGDLVASGALSELKVWRWDHDASKYACAAKLQGPPVSSYTDGKEVLVTSLHWTTSEKYGDLLMVTYMFHGAHLIETKQWTRVRSIPFGGKIGSASLSNDGALIAISNLTKGFDVYRMATEEPVACFEHDVGQPMPTPVLFTHGGRAIIGGTTVGKVNVWDVFLGKMNCLQIRKGSKVLAIAAHCKLGAEFSQDRLRIATGVFTANSPGTVILWEAQQLESAAGDKGTTQPEDGSAGRTHRVGRGQSPVSIIWLAGWVIVVGYILLLLIDEAAGAD